MMTELPGLYHLDSVLVASLPDRYSIGRTALYDRLKALGIEPEKRGRASFISANQLHQLDELDQRLKAGENLPDLSGERPVNLSGERPVNRSGAIAPSFEAAILTLAEAILSHQHSHPLARFEWLQTAAEQGWLLPTATLHQILGVRPRGQEFQRWGFQFVRVGRSGREVEWRVVKG